MSSTRTPPTPSAKIPRMVWILIFILIAIIVGETAGLLSYAGGASVPGAILTGGGAFAGALGLLLALGHFGTEK